MWYGYRVRWHDEDYRAAVDPRPDALFIRLYRSTPADGFDKIRPDHYVRVVPTAGCTEIRYITTVCNWRGAPFQVHDERRNELLVEYVGGQVPIARQLGLPRVERGVYRAWIPRADVTGLRENAVALDI